MKKPDAAAGSVAAIVVLDGFDRLPRGAPYNPTQRAVPLRPVARKGRCPATAGPNPTTIAAPTLRPSTYVDGVFSVPVERSFNIGARQTASDLLYILRLAFSTEARLRPCSFFENFIAFIRGQEGPE